MRQFVIIGNSAAGIASAEAIRKIDKKSKLIIITDEDCLAYCRCLISNYLSGELEEEKLLYRNEQFYSENNIELIRGKKVVKVTPEKNRIILEDKTQISYDCLLLANGARPKFPEIKGIQKRGCFGFRTIEDARRILEILPSAEHACILGGGLIGLKAAYGLKKRNLDVKVIVKSRQVLSQLIDEKAARLFQKVLEKNGIEIITGSEAIELIGNGELKAIKLDSGKALAAQIVVVGKGVSPNIRLIKDTSIISDRGIGVNEYMRTNIPNIYAAGDVCQSLDIVWQEPWVNALWPNAVEQGRIAGGNMAGENTKYEGSLSMNSVEFFGLPLISMGISRPKKDEFNEISCLDEKRNFYKKIVLKENLIVGAIFAGRIENAGIFLRLIKEKVDISSVKDELLSDSFSYATVVELFKEPDKVFHF